MYRNLIDNAIRYTQTGRQVTVSLDNIQPSKLTVTVSDTGSDIPLKRRARVFELSGRRIFRAAV
jgi:signal transduction histidine kinase